VRLARTLRLGLILGLTAVLYFVVPVDRQPSGGLTLRTALAVLLFGSLVVVVVVQFRRSLAADDERIDGLVMAVVLLAFMFALVYYGMNLRRPGEVAGLSTRLDSLYFVISTTLTVGFGDIHAAGQLARGVVIVQMLFNVIFVATAGALISSRVRDRAARRAADRAAGAGDTTRTLPRPRRRRSQAEAPTEPTEPQPQPQPPRT